MIRKGLWVAGLALAGLLAISPDAHAGVLAGYRGGPRHEVIASHPGWFWIAGHRRWYGPRYGWAPGGLYFRHPFYPRYYGGWRYRHGGGAFHRGGRHRR